MSATLSFRFTRPSAQSQATAPDLPVTLQRLSAGDGTYDVEPASRSLMIRAGSTRQLTDLDPGIYRIEVKIPGKSPFRKTVDVAEEGTTEVAIEMKGSAEPWLAWQTFAGNVPGPQAYERRNREHVLAMRSRDAANRERGRDLAGRTGMLEYRRGSELSRYRLPDLSRSASSDLRSSGPTSSTSRNAIRPLPLEIGISEWLDGAEDASARNLFKIMIPSIWPDEERSAELKLLEIRTQKASARVVGALGIEAHHQGDLLVDLWRFPSDYRRFDEIEPGGETPGRAVAVVDRGDDRYMASLPMPWIDQSFMASKIEVLFDRGTTSGHPLKVLVADPDHSALLAFLAARDMAAATDAFEAGHFAEQIRIDMQAKRRNPLAAAAAAYAGMVFKPGDPRRDGWSQWLVNLKDFFPTFPDGAILYARDRVERATGREDLVEALEAYVEGYRRGIPYFSLGIRQLRDGLARFALTAERYGQDRAMVTQMHEATSQLASRADPTQCFTVLRFRGEHDV